MKIEKDDKVQLKNSAPIAILWKLKKEKENSPYNYENEPDNYIELAWGGILRVHEVEGNEVYFKGVITKDKHKPKTVVWSMPKDLFEIVEKHPISMTPLEASKLEALKTLGFAWILRDFDGEIKAFETKPSLQREPTHQEWLLGGQKIEVDRKHNAWFEFIENTEKEPRSIEELLKRKDSENLRKV